MKIALMGLGSAGRSRLKALESSRYWECAGIISRRPECATLSWNQLVNDSSIQAVAVSTENTNHAEKTRLCLQAKKHVLCDYPLAFDPHTVVSLFELAHQNQCLLHVEHIALLSQDHAELKKAASNLGPLVRGTYRFYANWNSKIADPKKTGPYPFLSISRLVQIADALGPFHIADHKQLLQNDGFECHLTLQFQNGGVLDFAEIRHEGQKRHRTLEALFKKGPYTWQAQPQHENLFLKDLDFFGERLVQSKPCYYDESLVQMLTSQLAHFC